MIDWDSPLSVYRFAVASGIGLIVGRLIYLPLRATVVRWWTRGGPRVR